MSSPPRRKFRREPASQRKDDLIAATLQVISESGVRAATVRTIAERAEVTQGLIRHYFSSKEDLIAAAYEHHMTQMTDAVTTAEHVTEGTARDRLAGFVMASLSPPVVNPGWVALWSGFLNEALHDANLNKIHQRTYHHFRDQLEALIAAALREADLPATPERLRQLAIASNGVIDGLWLEGGALPQEFATGELAKIGLDSVAALTGLDLHRKATDT